MSDLIDRNAVLKLARDVCVPVGDDGVYRTRIISPQAVKEIPATAVPEELSEEAVAIEVAPQSLQKSRFGGEYQHALVKEDVAIEWWIDNT